MLHTAAVIWMLAQTLWVGAHASYLLIFMPALQQIGLAPLLLSEVHAVVRPGLLVLTLMALGIQMLALWRSKPLMQWITELRGLLVVMAVVLCLLLLVAQSMQLTAAPWARLAYGGLLSMGLLLLIQPLPEAPAR